MDLIYRFDPYQPVTPVRIADPNAAAEALRAGNGRFAEFVTRMQRRTLGEPAESIVVPISPVSLGLPFMDGTAPSQTPFALVLGCSDARVPVESIFDQGFNAIFVVRIAGNVLGTEGLGSIDYAVRQLGQTLKLIVALGHSQCGAVTAAVDTYLNPKDFAAIACTHALRTLVDGLMMAVRGAADALRRVGGDDLRHRPGYREALLEMAVYLNAAVTAFDVAREVRPLAGDGVRVVYGVYDLANVRVRAVPGGDATFGDAPTRAEDFMDLGMRLAQAVLAQWPNG